MEFFFLVVSAIVIFVSYALLSKSNIPIFGISCDMSGSTTLLSLAAEGYNNCSSSETTFTVDIAFAVYFIGLLAFIGWWLFILFVGVGLTAIPMDLINEFRNRPRRMSPNQFEMRRNKLLKHVQLLRKDGKHLESVKESVDNGKGIKGWKNKRTFNRDMTKFEARCMIAEREFILLEKISNMSKVEPFLYWLKLFAGIILILLSLTWIVHIFLWLLVKPNGVPVHPFLNNFLEGLRAGYVEFLSTTCFALLALYLLWATIKGNIKFGLRFF